MSRFNLEQIFKCYAGNKRKGCPLRDEKLLWSVSASRWQEALKLLSKVRLKTDKGSRSWLVLETGDNDSYLHLIETRKEKDNKNGNRKTRV